MDYKKFSLFDRIVVIVIILAAIGIFIYRTEQTRAMIKVLNQNFAAIAAWINHNAQAGRLEIPPQFRQPMPSLPPAPQEKKDAK